MVLIFVFEAFSLSWYYLIDRVNELVKQNMFMLVTVFLLALNDGVEMFQSDDLEAFSLK